MSHQDIGVLAEAPPKNRQAGIAMAIIAMARFMVVLDGTIMIVALPSIDNSLHMSASSLGWVLNAYALTFGGFMLVAGRIGDAYGRKDVFRVGLILFGVASVLGGIATTGTTLILARAVQGIGAAVATPGALSLLVSTFRKEELRTKALGVYGAATGLAAVLGLLLGGLLTTYASWRWVLFVNVPVVLAILVGLGSLVEGERVRVKIDIPGALAVTAGIGSLTFAVARASDHGWKDRPVIALLAAAAVLLAAFTLLQIKSKNPMIPREVVSDPGRVAANIVTFISYSGNIASYFFLTLYFQQILGYSALRTGLMYLPMAIGFGIGAGIATQLMAKTSEKIVLCAGLAISSAAWVALSFLTPHSSVYAFILPMFAIAGIGMGFTAVSSTGLGVRGIDSSEAGIGSALLTASSQVGSALGLAVLTTVAATATSHALDMHPIKDALTQGYSAAFIVVTGLCILCIGITLSMVKPTVQSPTEFAQ